MAISKCDLRDIDRFFQNKEAVFQNLFLLRQRYLSVFPPKKIILYVPEELRISLVVFGKQACDLRDMNLPYVLLINQFFP